MKNYILYIHAIICFVFMVTISPALMAQTVGVDENGYTYYEFEYTGAAQAWSPDGPAILKVEVWGAQGENGSKGGLGGYATGGLTISVTDELHIFTGQQPTNRSGGWNGGGDGGTGRNNSGGGGGASDVRLNGTSLGDRIIVGGGGGGRSTDGIGDGSGGHRSGGDGGGLTGERGDGGDGGEPGTQADGFALGQGGSGKNATNTTNHGANGGGGGGYYGGFGGQKTTSNTSGHGGGGGSSYIDGVDDGATETGQREGHGLVRITVILDGDGTEEYPYLIATANQLDMVRDYLDAHFEMTADIDLDVTPFNTGNGWEPIGTNDDRFEGYFDGGGHTISGLYINRDTEFNGLFGRVEENTEIKNLVLEDVNITSTDNRTGALAGLFSGDMSNIKVTGSIEGNEWVGGVAGIYSQGATAEYISTNVTITANGERAGAFAGTNHNNVSNSSFRGSVTGTAQVGGMAGGNFGGNISNVLVAVEINSAGANVGGLIGNMDDGTVDATTVFVDEGVANTGNAGNGTFRSTAQMKSANLYRDAGFDLDDTWGFNFEENDSYPFLQVHEDYGDNFRSDVTLSALSLDKGDIDFESQTIDYESIQVNFTGDVEVSFEPQAHNTVALASPQIVNFQEDEVVFTVEVTAEDLTTTGEYTITFKPLFDVGDGNTAPYEIATTEQLDAVRHLLNKNFILTSDLDLGGDDDQGEFWNSGEGWEPIGTDTEPFEGSINGDGYEISNLFINRTTTNVGFFGQTGEDSEISNLYLTNVSVTSTEERVGALGGRLYGSLSNIYVSGEISGNGRIGGIAGDNQADADLIAADVTVTTSTQRGGGFAGSNHGSIKNSYIKGSVTKTGGGDARIGGLVGNNFSGNIENNYVAVELTGSGGWRRGLIGDRSGGTITNSFVDMGVSNTTNEGFGTGLSTAEMNTYATFTDAGWDFDDIWGFNHEENDSYPFLRFQENFMHNLRDDANLANISVDQGTLDFDANTTEYEVVIFNGSTVEVSFSAQDHNTVEETSPQSVTIGNSEEVLELTVTAEDQETTKTYTITVKPLFDIGDGDTTPYEIATTEQFDAVRHFLDKNFVLSSDLDLGGDDDQGDFWNNGDGWEPIGDNDTPFEGTLDGNGHTISNLFIDRGQYSGLFGYIGEGANIHDLYLIDVDVTGGGDTGGLIGLSFGTVSNVGITGIVNGGSRTGGLIGYISSTGELSKAYSDVKVTGEGDRAGGLVGDNAGAVSDGYARGEVLQLKESDHRRAGGFAGYNSGSITRGYATGRVAEGEEYTSSWGWGGFTGRNSGGTITDSFFDEETTEQTHSEGGTGLSTAEMNTYATFTDAGWDFDDIWGFNHEENDSYPFLRFQDGLTHSLRDDATLADLSVDEGTLDYDSGTTSYEVFVLNGTTVEVTFESQTHNTVDKASPQSVTIVDSDEELILTVTAEDQEATQDYTITFKPFFAGGEGSEGSPYLIASAQQLDHIRLELDKNFTLTSDLDLGGDDVQGVFWNDGKGWEPIGTNADRFTGTFDGGGHTISGLYINRETAFNGLFGRVEENTEIKNLVLEDVDITSTDDRNGALAGNLSGDISNIKVTGSVEGQGWVGGVVGIFSQGATAEFISSDVTVTASDRRAGAFSGTNHNNVFNSSFRGKVTGDREVGGMSGGGELGDRTVSNVFVSVEIDSDGADVGGFMGTIITGSVNTATIFVDEDVANTADAGSGTFRSTTQMQSANLYRDAGWDLDDTWGFNFEENDSYPFLQLHEIHDNKFRDDANLADLSIDEGTLDFDANTTEYTVSLTDDIDEVIVSFSAQAHNVTDIESPQEVTITNGEGNVTITVTAEDQVTTKEYTITFENVSPNNVLYTSIDEARPLDMLFVENNGQIIQANRSDIDGITLEQIKESMIIPEGATVTAPDGINNGAEIKVEAANGDIRTYVFYGIAPKIFYTFDSGRIGMALDESGHVYTYGAGASISLGHGNEDNQTRPKRVTTSGFDELEIIDITSGRYYALFLDSEGRVYAIGDEDVEDGRRGLGENVPKQNSPVQLAGDIVDRKIIAITAGNRHSLLLDTEGRVYSFGYGHQGRLGHGNTDNQFTPKEITTGDIVGRHITSISAGNAQSFLTDNQGRVYSFGMSNRNGRGGQADIPLEITGNIIADEYIVAVSSGLHALMTDLQGNVYSFGGNDHGQLGWGTTSYNESDPAKINHPSIAESFITSISASDHSLLSDSEGRVFSFGRNSTHQLGHGHDNAVTIPQQITNNDFDQIYIQRVNGGFLTTGLTDREGRFFAVGSNGHTHGLGMNNRVDAPSQINFQLEAELHAPENEATDVSTNPQFAWSQYPLDVSYSIQISTQESFEDAALWHISTTGIEDNSFQLDENNHLEPNTTYYWRIAIRDSYATLGYNEPFSFTTGFVIENGSGTEADPYIVSSSEDLEFMANERDAHYALDDDLDLGDEPWTPIGTDGDPFTGSFNGNGHVITGLVIDQDGEDNVGFFGVIGEDGLVENVIIEDANVSGDNNVGIIAGVNNGTITNAFGSGQVSGESHVGGLVGINNAEINDSYSTADVSAESGPSGGLVAVNEEDGSITNTYATGEVSGDANDIGGLVGVNNNDDEEIAASFWNTETSGQAESAGGEGKTSAELQDYHFWVDAGWDFDTIWGFNHEENDGMPFLRIQDGFTHSLRDDATLASLSISQGVLNFDASTTAYTVELASKPASVDVTFATQNGNTADITSPYTFELTDGEGSLTIEVLAEDQTSSQSYTITFEQVEIQGEGTPEDPFLIVDIDQIDIIIENPDAHFELAADLDLSDEPWIPIGTVDDPFTGNFDGKGHVISGLEIDGEGEDNIGFFGAIGEDGVVENVIIEDANVSGDHNVGIIAGVNKGTIRNAFASGQVSGESHVGGLVGINNAEIRDSYSTADVSAESGPSGGLVAVNEEDGSIVNTYATGEVAGEAINIGGLVGVNNNDAESITASYWDIETSGRSESAGGEGQTTETMQSFHFWADTGWDFDDTWGFNHEENDGYPFLRVQEGMVHNLRDDATIAGMSINRGTLNFNSATTDYTVKLWEEYADVQFSIATHNGNAINLESLYTMALTNGEGSLTIEVTAEDQQNLQSYVITFEKHQTDGEGTEEDPFIIVDAEQIDIIIENPDAHIDLDEDIDLDGKPWTPIGTVDQPFTGTFNGNGRIIRNLVINETDQNNTGFFGHIAEDAVIKNIGFENADVSGAENVGIVAGRNDGNISNVFVSGKVSGESHVGGLVGLNTGVISNTFSQAEVESEQTPSGGLVGHNNEGSITSSYAAGVVAGDDDAIGGLVGSSENGTTEQSFWDTEISGQANSAGGVGADSQTMKSLATFVEAEWDFEEIWGLNSEENQGYPFLRFQGYEHETPLMVPEQLVLTSPADEAEELSLRPEFSWNEDELAENYELRISTALDFESLDVEVQDISDTSYELTEDLNYATTYYWSARAVNASGAGQWSEPFSFTTQPDVPAQVVLQTPDSESGGVTLLPEFSWQQTDHAQQYELQISESENFEEVQFSFSELSETSYTLEDSLNYYHTYFWRVRASNTTGHGEWSDVFTMVTEAAVPQTLFPQNGITNVSIAPQVQWQSDYAESEFRFQLSTANDFNELVVDTLIGGQRFELNSLTSDTEYFWQVRVEDESTHSRWTDAAAFVTRPDPVEVSEEDLTVAVNFGGITNPDELVESDYRMISIPGSEPFRFEDVFSGEAGEDWTAWIDTGSEQDFYVEFDVENEDFIFTPGNGFWVMSKDVVAFERLLDAVEVNEQDTYSIPLQSGWNIIGNPFHFPVSWDEVQVLNDITENLLSYEGSYQPVDVLTPFEGYYFYNDPNDELTHLNIPYSNLESRGMNTEAITRLEELASSRITLSTDFNQRGGLREQQSVRFVFPQSNEVPMESFTQRVPAGYGNVSMMMKPEEYSRTGKRGFADFFNETGEQYEVELKAPVGTKVTWEAEISDMPEQARVLLVHPITYQSHMLNDGESVEILASEPKVTYDVYIGNEAYLDEIRESLLPDEISLKPNYPNPFNPTTNIRYALPEATMVRIEVYDILGRRVQVLQSGHQNAGWHLVQFDARSLASGVYFYRLQAGNTMMTEKMMLIK